MLYCSALRYLICIAILAFSYTGLTQLSSTESHQIDSIKKIVSNAKNDTVKILAYRAWDDIIYSTDSKLDKVINQKILVICEKGLKDKTISAKEKFFLKQALSSGYNILGVISMDEGKNAIAIEYYLKCLSLCEDLGNKKGAASAWYNMGIVHKGLGENKEALEYYLKSLKVRTQIKDHQGEANSLNAIGGIYFDEKKFDQALDYYQKGLIKNQAINSKRGISNSLSNIGNIYTYRKDFAKALAYYEEALMVAQTSGDLQGISGALNNICLVYKETGDVKKSIQYGKRALDLAREMGVAIEIRESSKLLYKNYKDLKLYKDALEMNELYYTMRDSILSEENKSAVMKQELQYNYQKKKELDEKENEKKIAISNERENKQRVINYAVSIGLLLVLVFAFFALNRWRVTRKQRNIIQDQKHVVEQKQKEIIDSMNYAKRLQDAILPPESFLKKHLNEAFIVYLPKDIVAGDFYWMEFVNKGRKQLTFFAVADSTGHGIPGAMVSVVCSNALHRSVFEFDLTEPGKILDKARELILETFAKSNENVKDGMDISLCCLENEIDSKVALTVDIDNSINIKDMPNVDSIILTWSGANNPLWIMEKETGLMKETIADKQPVGKSDNPTPFKTHSFKLKKGDVIYLFSDGYTDQFGGPKGKKFKRSNLNSFLTKISIESMEAQKVLIEKEFNSWQGDLEQIDDVCVMGVRV